MNLNTLQKILDGHAIKEDFGYAIGIVKEDSLVFSQARGYADIEKQVLISTSTNFRLASVSKQFIAIGILIMLQRKQLSLEDTLIKFFPKFPEYGKTISLYHLLTHTSGLRNYEDLIPRDQTWQIHDEGVLDLLMSQQNGLFPSGKKYSYSNGGYCLLRLIIEEVSRQSIDDFLKKEIFIPLDIMSTVVNREGKTLIQNRAYGHSYLAHKLVPTDQDRTSATIGDGGIYSSIDDMQKVGQILHTNIILSQEMRDMLLHKHVLTDEGEGVYYGFGLYLKEKDGKQIAYHGGSSIGFQTGIYSILNENITIIFLSNLSGDSGSLIAEQIADVFIGTNRT